jgi:hypothetical protein
MEFIYSSRYLLKEKRNIFYGICRKLINPPLILFWATHCGTEFGGLD